MFYIFGRNRENRSKHFWNRRKGVWQEDLTPACHYPTESGVDRVWRHKSTFYRREDRAFDEIGWKRLEA